MTNEKLVSIRAYARHRGITPASVHHAIKVGRLHQSIEVDGNGKPKIRSVAIADAEWARSTPIHSSEVAKSTLDIENLPPLAVSRARLQQTKAQIAELELREKQRRLIPIEDVRKQVGDVFSTVRTRLLAIPSDARQRIPKLDDGDVAVLDALVREALEHLAGEIG